DLHGQVPRHQRTMAMEEEVVRLRPVAAADDVDVAHPLRDQQAGLRALALDQRVDGGGRAVDELVDRLGLEAALLDAVDDALDQAVRRGQALRIAELAGLVVEGHEVGKRAADIDCNYEHGNSWR